MAALISAREMFSVFIGSSSLGCKTGWWIGGGRFSTSSKCSFQRVSCSSALARISPSLLRIGLFWLDFLPLRIKNSKNSGSLVQPVEISLTCSFFSVCGHLVDIGPLVSSTSFLYLPSFDSILLHSIPFFKPGSSLINIYFQLSPFLNLPPSIVRDPLLPVPFHFP